MSFLPQIDKIKVRIPIDPSESRPQIRQIRKFKKDAVVHYKNNIDGLRKNLDMKTCEVVIRSAPYNSNKSRSRDVGAIAAINNYFTSVDQRNLIVHEERK